MGGKAVDTRLERPKPGNDESAPAHPFAQTAKGLGTLGFQTLLTTARKGTPPAKAHEGLPLSFAADFPDMYANMSRDDRDARAVIGTDQCIIDQQWFFLRGCLEIPITGESDPFLWGLWASIREDVFDDVSACWELAGREKTRGPYKGRLANSLSIYPETLNLRLSIALQPLGTRPLFTVEEVDHPLAQAQRSGISHDQARHWAALLLHQEK